MYVIQNSLLLAQLVKTLQSTEQRILQEPGWETVLKSIILKNLKLSTTDFSKTKTECMFSLDSI